MKVDKITQLIYHVVGKLQINWESLSNLCGLPRKLNYDNDPSQRVSTSCSRLDLVFDWHCSRRENNLVNPKMAKMPRKIYCAVYLHSHFLRNF